MIITKNNITITENSTIITKNNLTITKNSKTICKKQLFVNAMLFTAYNYCILIFTNTLPKELTTLNIRISKYEYFQQLEIKYLELAR